MSIGQEIKDARRVVVLIERADGKQVGWEVKPSGPPRWAFIGLGTGGTHGEVTVRGEFYRMGRSGPEQTEIDQTMKEIER